jgi:predicted oxidoreductase
VPADEGDEVPKEATDEASLEGADQAPDGRANEVPDQAPNQFSDETPDPVTANVQRGVDVRQPQALRRRVLVLRRHGGRDLLRAFQDLREHLHHVQELWRKRAVQRIPRCGP